MEIDQLIYDAFTIRKTPNDGPVAERYEPRPYEGEEFSPNSLLKRLQISNTVKVVICVTSYNETDREFRKTMRGVLKDAQTMLRRGTVRSLKDDLLVVLLADGLDRVNDSLGGYLKELGLFSRQFLVEKGFVKLNLFKKKLVVKDELFEDEETSDLHEDNLLHCFQRQELKEFDLTADERLSIIESQFDDIQGINVVCAVKHHNAGKLNSHLFFFKGLCQYLHPQYVVLLDIGTEPRKGAINQSISYLDSNRDVGGVCGTVDVEVNKICFKNSMEGLVRYSQYYEYKISNYLDKAAQNLFGFISVLPGAFSVYRMEAIQGTPLKAYF